MIDFDEVVYYNIIKLRFGVDAVISAKILVQKCLNNTDEENKVKKTLDIWLQNAYIISMRERNIKDNDGYDMTHHTVLWVIMCPSLSDVEERPRVRQYAH